MLSAARPEGALVDRMFYRFDMAKVVSKAGALATPFFFLAFEVQDLLLLGSSRLGSTSFNFLFRSTCVSCGAVSALNQFPEPVIVSRTSTAHTKHVALILTVDVDVYSVLS